MAGNDTRFEEPQRITDRASDAPQEDSSQQTTLYRIASGAASVALALGWLLLKLAFVAAPVIAFYLMSVLPDEGFGKLGMHPQFAEALSILGGLLVVGSHIGWAVLTFSYLFGLDPERDFHWYAEHVGFFVVGIYACAFIPTAATILKAVSQAGGA